MKQMFLMCEDTQKHIIIITSVSDTGDTVYL